MRNFEEKNIFIYLALASRSSGFVLVLKIVDFFFASEADRAFQNCTFLLFSEVCSHLHNQNLFWFDFRSNYQVPPKRQRPLQRFHLLQIAQWVKMSKKYQKFCAKKNSDMRFINFSGFFFTLSEIFINWCILFHEFFCLDFF